MHIRCGIHVNKETNSCDDEKEERSQLVNLESERNGNICEMDKIKILNINGSKTLAGSKVKDECTEAKGN